MRNEIVHKLLVSDIIKLNKGIYDVEVKSDKIDIEVNEEVTIYLINQKIKKLNLKLEENSILNIYIYNNNIDNKLNVNIKSTSNSKLYYRQSLVNKEDSSVNIDNDLVKDNNVSDINIRNISNNGLSKIVVNVTVDKKTKDNIALEDLKGINNEGFVHIEPNIICLSNEVVANHLTTIGNVSEESLNYLMGKGIKKENAKKMLLNNFIIGNMDEYMKQKIGGE